jgi:hypothetical protein
MCGIPVITGAIGTAQRLNCAYKNQPEVLYTDATDTYSNNCENPGIHVNKLYGRRTKSFTLKVVVHIETTEM